MIGRGLVAQKQKEFSSLMDIAEQEEHEGILNFRHEIGEATKEKAKADDLRRKESIIGRGVSCRLEKIAEMNSEKEEQAETADMLDFRRAIAIHKAEKLKEDKEKRRNSFEIRGEVAREHKEKEMEINNIQFNNHKDALNFRHETAVAKAEKLKKEKDTKRESLQGRGEAARGHQQIDLDLEQREENDLKDMLNFRHETAVAKAEKMYSDEERRRESLERRGEVARRHQEMKLEVEKSEGKNLQDILNFRHEIAMAKAEKIKAAAEQKRESLEGRGEVARNHQQIEADLNKIELNDRKDALNFRYETAVAKAEKLKEEKNRKRESLQGRGEVAQAHQQMALEVEQGEGENVQDILNFRHETAVTKAKKIKADQDNKRESLEGRGEVARQHQQIDMVLKQAERNSSKDILNFRHETAVAKAEKMKADAEQRRESLEGRGEIARDHQQIDLAVEQREGNDLKDILNFRHQTAVAKAEKMKADQDAKRDSFEGRGEVARKHQQIEADLKNITFNEHKDALSFRHEIAVAKADKKAADDKERRNSLAHRLTAWRGQKKLQEEIDRQQKLDLEVIIFKLC